MAKIWLARYLNAAEVSISDLTISDYVDSTLNTSVSVASSEVAAVANIISAAVEYNNSSLQCAGSNVTIAATDLYVNIASGAGTDRIMLTVHGNKALVDKVRTEMERSPTGDGILGYASLHIVDLA